MKIDSKLFHYLLLACLVLLFLKPWFTTAHEQNKPLSTTYYSTNNHDCSSRTPVATYCQVAAHYTLTENEIDLPPYRQILAAVLFFSLISLRYKAPLSRLYKPPIILN